MSDKIVGHETVWKNSVISAIKYPAVIELKTDITKEKSEEMNELVAVLT